MAWSKRHGSDRSFRTRSHRKNQWMKPRLVGTVVVFLYNPVTTCRGYISKNIPFTHPRQSSMSKRGETSLFHRCNVPFRLSTSSRTLSLRQSKSSDPHGFDFKDFDIDDILSEAEDALKTAERSLENENSTSEKGVQVATATKRSREPSQSTIQAVPSPQNTSQLQQVKPTMKGVDGETLKNAVASTMGGVLFGSLLGSIASFQFPQVLSTLESDNNIIVVPPIFILPLLGGLTLSIVGLIGSLQDNIFGSLSRNLLAVPVLALVSAMLSAIQGIIMSVQLALQRQVEQTVNDIKSLPQNLANSAQQTVKASVESAVEEVTSLPRKARDKVVETSVQAADNVKSSVVSAVEEVTSLPAKARDNILQTSTQAVENVKSLPRKAKDTVVDSGILSTDFLLSLVVIPSLIALGFLVVDALLAGRVPAL
ncbi:hypothetical protein IV203_035040 [Nitzschia inconspicua]|uniref:Uncharacterized protein n=1 Tax=Nitzschia inconspicua TaxID=303405 RepID=A0A9K3LD31_9STRA|nr:hypothetical protein IV203_035040 [Nitzschia inconspicua]